MSENEPRDIGEIFAEGTEIDRALREAVRQALIRHKRLGQSVVVWQDGKTVWLTPDQIPVDLDEEDQPATPQRPPGAESREAGS